MTVVVGEAGGGTSGRVEAQGKHRCSSGHCGTGIPQVVLNHFGITIQ
jgi:hypothetical protein